MGIHRHILHNGKIRDAAEACLFPGQLGLLSGWGVFSTLRVAQGSLFAWERHWARMSRDARLLNVPMPADPDAVQRDLLSLIEANGQTDCTLRFVVVRNSGGMWDGPSSGNAADTLALTAGSKQWGESARLGVQPHGRYSASDFTRAKIISWADNLRWAEIAHERGLDEVVLLNERSRVAECTSANLFAVFGDRVFTPPLGDGCLPGITREILLTAIDVEGIQIVERGLTLESLYQADEVFMTSTTRDLLAVREIVDLDGSPRQLNRNGDVRRRLSEAFRRFVETDIAARQSARPTTNMVTG